MCETRNQFSIYRFQRIECQTVENFLNALSPRGPYCGQDYDPDRWIFRGQANGRWPLLPSAFREPYLRETNREQIEGEIGRIQKFFALADASGLTLPEDSQATRQFLRTLDYGSWPPDRLLSLIALAQHYGVATRLLNWTWDARIAAYFAAVGAAEEIRVQRGSVPPTERLAVWALCGLGSIQPDDPSGFARTPFGYKETAITLVTAPGAEIPNLHAQRGVFTLYRPKEMDLHAAVDCRPFDVELEGAAVRLKCFYIPVQDAPQLMRMLAKEGINAARLFPGYGGVARAMREEEYWDWENSPGE